MSTQAPTAERSPSPSSRTSPQSSSRARLTLERAQGDPVWFAREVLGVHLWSRQRDILESVRDHPRTAVRSGHGVGKTMSAAVALLWFLYSFPRSRVVTTATKWSQVEKLLWHEVNQLHAHARFPLGGDCLNTELRLPDGRYALGLSSKPENAESFQGHHAPHILVIYDEASGIPAPIFEAGEGYMTTDGAKALLIGNPTRPQGEFFAAFHSKRTSYNTIVISALDSPPITGEEVPDETRAALTGQRFIDSALKMWGEESPMYQVRVLGRFPARPTDSVIGLGAVEDAQERELPAPVDQYVTVIACDVARFGDDETVIGTRTGPQVRIRETYVGQDTTVTTGHIMRMVREFGPHCRVVVDDAGVGGGVTDQVREKLREGDPIFHEVQVTGFNGGETAFDPDDYPNRRSELWFAMADRLPELDLEPDEQLAADLTAPVYKLDSSGRRVVERKDETKKRLGRSPDRGDFALLTLVPATQTVVREPPQPQRPVQTGEWASESVNPQTEPF